MKLQPTFAYMRLISTWPDWFSKARFRLTAIWIWGIALVVLMFGHNAIPAEALVLGLSLGLIVGVWWKKFSALAALVVFFSVGFTAVASFLLFRFNFLWWNGLLCALAIVGIGGRWRWRRAVTIPNVVLSGGLACCLTIVGAALLEPRIDWEGIVWLPFVLLSVFLVPLIVFMIGCVAVSFARRKALSRTNVLQSQRASEHEGSPKVR